MKALVSGKKTYARVNLWRSPGHLRKQKIVQRELKQAARCVCPPELVACNPRGTLPLTAPLTPKAFALLGARVQMVKSGSGGENRKFSVVAPLGFFLGLCCVNLVWDSDWALRWMANEAGNLISSCSECVYKPSFRCLCCARSTECSERKITDRSRGEAIVTRAHVYVFSNHSTTWDSIEGW